jgi:putative spermidine/putrescine transport system ATP-binding protein
MKAPTQRRTAPGREAGSATPHDDGPAPAIRLVDVRKSYGDVPAVDGVTLTVGTGEFFTMLGPSGSGKTTLLRVIAGFEVAGSGQVFLHGRDVTRVPPYDRDVNTVFQDYALFPHMSVAQNVEYGLRVKRVPRARRQQRAAEALSMVGLAEHGRRKPSELSGGQRQRVALARAIVNRPMVLLLDEPLGALDLKLRQSMQLELKRIQREAGITFVYVTHDQEEALTMSDRIAVFNAGRIQQVGSPVEIYEAPQTEYVANFIGVSNILQHDGVAYSVRPERIDLITDGAAAAPGAVTMPATVSEVIYLGVMTRFQLRLDDDRRVAVVRQNATPSSAASAVAPGARVQLAWRPDQSHQLRTDPVPDQQPRETDQ